MAHGVAEVEGAVSRGLGAPPAVCWAQGLSGHQGQGSHIVVLLVRRHLWPGDESLTLELAWVTSQLRVSGARLLCPTP